MNLGRGWLSGLRLAATSSVPIYGAVCYVRKNLLGQRIAYADRCTDLCIEGYPSSGNTFATDAVRGAWPGMSIASHRHAVAAVHRAAELGKPIVILTREPEEAISSCVVRFGWPVRHAIRSYIHFYERTAALTGVRHFDFAHLLSRPRNLLVLVHELTGAPLPHDDNAQTSEEFREERTHNMQHWGVNPQQWWIPHPEKNRLKAAVKRQLVGDVALMSHAHALYARLGDVTAPASEA